MIKFPLLYVYQKAICAFLLRFYKATIITAATLITAVINEGARLTYSKIPQEKENEHLSFSSPNVYSYFLVFFKIFLIQ